MTFPHGDIISFSGSQEKASLCSGVFHLSDTCQARRSLLSHSSFGLELNILVWFLCIMVCVCKANDTGFPLTIVL